MYFYKKCEMLGLTCFGTKGLGMEKSKYKVPLKASATCTENLTVRVSKELKLLVTELDERGVDVPELIRGILASELAQAKSELEKAA